MLEGDHVTLVNIYNAFLDANKSPEWCQEQFLNYRSLIRYLYLPFRYGVAVWNTPMIECLMQVFVP